MSNADTQTFERVVNDNTLPTASTAHKQSMLAMLVAVGSITDIAAGLRDILEELK